MGNGFNFMVRVNPIIGNDENYILSQFIKDYESELGFVSLAHLKRPSWLDP